MNHPKWYTNTKGTQGLVYEEETGKNVAVSYDVKDARLIASAPELLEALEEIVNVAIECDPRIIDLVGRERFQIARAAIEKATS